MDTMQSNNLFTSSYSVRLSRILYTPSSFARSSMLHLQEVGSLTALKPHTSRREKLQSYLCFVVEDGEGELVYEGKQYALKGEDVVFIDCRKAAALQKREWNWKKLKYIWMSISLRRFLWMICLTGSLSISII